MALVPAALAPVRSRRHFSSATVSFWITAMAPWTCETCGAQFSDSGHSPAACPICEDERQYVNWKGQTFLTCETLTAGHRLVWRDDLDLTGIAMEPAFAIGQRALLVPLAEGCVMWDCVP